MLISFPHYRSQVADFFSGFVFIPFVHLALSMNACLKARLVEISIFEKSVLEREAFLLSLAPFFVVKVDISALFILLGNSLRFFVPLEPHHVFGMKPPGLLLQCLSGQVLGFSPFQVVKNEEERLRREPMEKIQ